MGGRGSSSKANRATYKRYESKSDTSASGSFLNSTLARGLPESEHGKEVRKAYSENKKQAQQEEQAPTNNDTKYRDKYANAFDNITSAKLDKMSRKQLLALARKATVYMLPERSKWERGLTESTLLERFDLLADAQPKTSLKKSIMKAKKLSKQYGK